MWPRRRRDAPGPYLFDEHFPHGGVPTGDPVELVGIAHHDRGSLYQFVTTDGTYVTLHELACAGVDVRFLERTLTLLFTHERSSGPVLRMHFAGARILRWRLDTPVAPDEHRGQASDLWWDNRQTFALYLIDDEIAFTATRLTVTTHGMPDLR
ncbi:hypothetical protein [Arsenicicoccus dermatophilus]|uniref:hypothetical protein n=1 Tax=Arsenicicoccus dermatophilus TaxID=1076331 RepID=UPI003916D226